MIMNKARSSAIQQRESLTEIGMRRTYRKRILSTIAGIGMVVSLCYALTLWLVYDNLLSSLTDCLYALAYLGSFYWIRQGRYTLSAYWLTFWAGVQITTGSIFFVGPETGFHLYFLVLPVIIYLLLAKQPVWAIAMTASIGAVAFVASHTLSVDTFRAPISPVLAQTIFIINVLIVFAVIFFAVKFFADETEHAFGEQQKLVQTDSLTGLFNDRFIRQHASKLLSLCDRYGHPMSVVRLSVDQFDDITQAHGFGVAERALKHIADLLRSDVRDADIVARNGGADFVLLLPEIQMEAALISAERLRRRVQDSPLQINGLAFGMTASLGVSDCESNSMTTIEQLIAMADNAMQQARAQGGNQLVQQQAQTGP